MENGDEQWHFTDITILDYFTRKKITRSYQWTLDRRVGILLN